MKIKETLKLFQKKFPIYEMYISVTNYSPKNFIVILTQNDDFLAFMKKI